MPEKPAFKVAEKRCDQCLFSGAKVVCDDRRDEILDKCEREDRHFVCHKFSIDDPDSTTCCRGFYDREPHATTAMRLGAMLDIVEFVPVPEVES